MEHQERRASGISIMRKLIGLVKPLMPVMCLAIFLGVIGYLAAIFVTIVTAYGIIRSIMELIFPGGQSGGWLFQVSWPVFFAILLVLAISRGFFHYGEQYCNHFIAFKLLAMIRHKVFAKLRELCPAKLEGRDKGDLIALITSDIELLEVFYAHTLSPIAIGFTVSVIMTMFIGFQSVEGAGLAVAAYLTVGVFLPLWNGRKGNEPGKHYRKAFGDLNSFLLESVYGVEEVIQYGAGTQRSEQIEERSRFLGNLQNQLSRLEGSQRAMTNLAIQIFSLAMLALTGYQFVGGEISFSRMLLATIAMMGSFGPVVALSNLSNNLNQTLACGERVLDLLNEDAKIEEVTGQKEITFDGAGLEHVAFAYDKEEILKNCSLDFPKGKMIGIHGPSGSGKSTVLKLLMRFWEADSGSVVVSGKNVREINSRNLRNMEAYVTQETWLFHDTIANNIAIGREDASRQEIEEAAKKASLHEFIMSLPDGYDSRVGELGDKLSGGERQRIGIARAFLHRAPLMLLDEPTSNLDSLNEGIILKALKESSDDKTIVLVSHRKSTMAIVDSVVEMDNSRRS